MAVSAAALPRLLLLDYGGVLLHLNDPVETFGVGSTRADFIELWLMSPAVQAYERGLIDPGEFATRIVQDLALPYPPDDFIERFNAWPDRIRPETGAWLRAVPEHIDCAILSNTNDLHWRAQTIDRDLGGRISTCFLSFETGLVKPEPSAFQHVLEQKNVDAGDVLFVDDNPKNTQAAASLGMRAELCPGVDQLGRVLINAGIIPG